MKQYTIATAFLAAGLVIGFLVYHFYTPAESSNYAHDAAHKIAIIMPISHPSLENIKQGLIDTLEKKSPGSYHFKTYDAGGNKTLMLSQIEEILGEKYNLIVPIATSPAQMLKVATIRKKVTTPIVFIAADIMPLEQEITNITGIIDTTPFEEQMKALKKCKPGLKDVTVVYNAGEPKVEKEKEGVRKLCEDENIHFDVVKIYQTNEVYTKVESFLVHHTPEVILVLKDNTVVAGIDGLIKLCTKKGITLMASDLDSVEKGAALGFGVQEYDLGVAAADLVIKILEEKMAPCDIPVNIVSNCKLVINSRAAPLQGVNVENALRELKKEGTLYQGR